MNIKLFAQDGLFSPLLLIEQLPVAQLIQVTQLPLVHDCKNVS